MREPYVTLEEQDRRWKVQRARELYVKYHVDRYAICERLGVTIETLDKWLNGLSGIKKKTKDRPWTRKEYLELLRLKKAGYSNGQCGKKLKRTRGSICGRLHRGCP